MIGLSFQGSRFYFLLATLAILLTLITSAIFGNLKSFAQTSKSNQNQMNSPTFKKGKSVGNKSFDSVSKNFVTMDAKEFQHIQNVIQEKGGSFDLNVVERRDGILMVEAEERQILTLTKEMHEEFQKCGGFIWHETAEAARRSMEENSPSDSNLRVVEYTINNPTLINGFHREAEESQIRETINRLSTDYINRRYDSPSGLQSANWIKNKWTELAAGRRDVTVEFFHHSPSASPQPSIIMTVRGTTFPDEVIVVGGHQDSINRNAELAPGADDDASGIASMTEAIRVLFAKNFHPQRTVKFMAYAAEEVGLRGSHEIALDFQTRGVNIIGVLQLDMTNYKSASSPADIGIVTDYTNAAQNQFLRDLIAAYQPNLIVANTTCGYACSDHFSWNYRGFPASFPFEAPFPYKSPYIHQTSDTIAQSGSNADHAVKFTRLALSYLGELAKETIGISGIVVYGTTPANEPQKFVPGVQASAEGASSATTDAAGLYLLKNLTSGGSYTVTLSKTGDSNGITALDATMVLRHLAYGEQSANALNQNQILAADANSSGTITAIDATAILRYAASGKTTETGAIGQWKFTPAPRSYSAFSGFAADGDYAAVLIGDVNGSWKP